jgi:uncharacterized metal-binding protein
MPNHTVHDTIALITTPIAAAGGAAALHIWGGQPLQPALTSGAILAASHLISSYYLSPDLDLRSAIAPRWGPLSILWKPYEFIVPHRSWLSHSGISALLRLAYLGLIVSLILSALGIITGVYDTGLWLYDLATTHPHLTILILTGAILADLIHVAADLITSEIRHLTSIITIIGAIICVWLFS